MNRLIKPKKQSYTGDDAQVLAYARICEMAWATSLGMGSIGAVGLYMAALHIAVPPLMAAMGVSLVVHWAIFSAGCRGWI